MDRFILYYWADPRRGFFSPLPPTSSSRPSLIGHFLLVSTPETNTGASASLDGFGLIVAGFERREVQLSGVTAHVCMVDEFE